MKRSLHVDAAAVEELLDAAAWYGSQSLVIGNEFEHAVNVALDLLEQDLLPLTLAPGRLGERGIKFLRLRRFPYTIVVIERNHDIFVVAFAHHARRPDYWMDRLRGA